MSGETGTTKARTTRTSNQALRATLVVLGAVSVFVAVNVAFGGLQTLGLQGPTRYFQVTDHDAYLVRDSHTHYYGGVYLALGVSLIVAASNVQRFRTALFVVFAMIFAGGLARLTQFEPGVTFGRSLLLSTVIELVGVPLLAVWVARSTSGSRMRVGVEAVSNLGR
jgi:hypothetical protein